MKKAKRKVPAILLAAILLPGLSSGSPASQGGDEILAKLNLAPTAAKESVILALASGNAYNEAAIKAFKVLPAAARSAVVSAGLGWIKAFAASAEFKAAYNEFREGKKPQRPAPRPSADEQTKKMKADMEKNIAEMRKNMAAMDAETKKAMEGAIKEMRAQMEKMEKDPGQRDLMRQIAEMSAAEDQKHYDGELKTWEEKFPADPRALIKRRIGEFLAASADVDYAAKLVPRGDLLVFADEGYERKPAAWKLCFRAGREATATARAFAKVWLAELGKS